MSTLNIIYYYSVRLSSSFSLSFIILIAGGGFLFVILIDTVESPPLDFGGVFTECFGTSY